MSQPNPWPPAAKAAKETSPMHTQKLRQSVLIPAPAEEVFEALLDAPTLSRIFGRPAQCSSAVGGEFRFFGGLVHGSNLEVERPGRIVQSFRYALPAWPMDHLSRVTLQLRQVPDGTRLILDHSGIPSGCGESVAEHWHDHVWPGLKSLLQDRAAGRLRAAKPRFSLRRKLHA